MTTINGPAGPFEIPEGAHPRTAEVCRLLTESVFRGEYDHPELAFDDVPPQDLVVLDVGAGWGAFSAWALGKWACSVVAYEPHAEAAAYWRRNLATAVAWEDARLVEAAVTAQENVRINGGEDWGSWTLEPKGECGRDVPLVHPRDLPPCDILKCDAEHSEVEILSGYPHLAKCRALLIEFHDLEKKRAVREIAERAGFRCLREEPEPATYGVSLWVK